MALELIPIGTILAVLTNLVIKTAQAAKDIIIEKDSFKVLSKHLFDIESVLKELLLNELTDSPTVRLALVSLEADVEKANNLVEKYKKRSRFYLLIKCRYIVNEVQEVTRNIGRSLALVPLASTEVLSGISDQVNRLQNEMQRVEFEASHSQLQILDKLNQGLRDQKFDQGFANDMLEEIAKAVGVPVEHSEISKELASFRKEKEEASNRNERVEVLFLEQVIELLSQADAARDHEEVRKQYFQRLQVIERYDAGEEYYIPSLNPFVCPLTMTVMVDPVSLCTGTTCERAAIEAWFDRGKRTDPETGEVLEDTSLRSNLPLRKSIQEWRELNHCLKIRCCREKLTSGVDSSENEALSQMQDLMRESSINKYWISIGGLTDIIVSILGTSRNKYVKKNILVTLKQLVEGHARKKQRCGDTHIDIPGGNSNDERKDWDFEWIFVITNVVLQSMSAIFTQLSSKQKPQYALFGVLVSYLALLICIIEIIYEGHQQIPIQRGTLSNNRSQRGKSFDTLNNIVALACALGECVVTTVNYRFDSPIKLTVLPIILANGVLFSKILKYRNRSSTSISFKKSQ